MTNFFEFFMNVLAAIGAANVLLVLALIIYLSIPHPEDQYQRAKRITREKFDKVNRGRRPW